MQLQNVFQQKNTCNEGQKNNSQHIVLRQMELWCLKFTRDLNCRPCVKVNTPDKLRLLEIRDTFDLTARPIPFSNPLCSQMGKNRLLMT